MPHTPAARGAAEDAQSDALLREELERALHRAAQWEDIADAAQAAIDTLRERLARCEEERAETLARAAGEGAALRAERDRLAEERDALRAECDRLAREAQWFDAAIQAGLERIAGAHPIPGWRIGRYRVQVSPVRGAGSPIQRADRARAARRWERAARFYLDALEQRSPDRPAIWVQLGHALKETGKPAEAEFAYRRAVALDRRNIDALIALGQLLRQEGREDEAVPLYRRALDLAPSTEQRAFLCGELSAPGPSAG